MDTKTDTRVHTLSCHNRRQRLEALKAPRMRDGVGAFESLEPAWQPRGWPRHDVSSAATATSCLAVSHSLRESAKSGALHLAPASACPVTRSHAALALAALSQVHSPCRLHGRRPGSVGRGDMQARLLQSCASLCALGCRSFQRVSGIRLHIGAKLCSLTQAGTHCTGSSGHNYVDDGLARANRGPTARTSFTDGALLAIFHLLCVHQH